MYLQKRYGQSQQNLCVFCGKSATVENAQGVKTCIADQRLALDEKKCACGEMLELKKGKYGAFFLCRSCGPISLKKGLDMDPYKAPKKVTLPDGHKVLSVYDLKNLRQ